MPTTKLAQATYRALVREVRAIIENGRRRVKREIARTYWENGRAIERYILKGKKRAPLGERVILSLAKETGESKSMLYHSLEFYRANPVFQTFGKLEWSDHLALLSINNPTERKKLTQQAIAADWTVRELKKEIKKYRANLPNAKSLKPLKPKCGKVGAYRRVLRQGKWHHDLGFSNYFYKKGLRAQKRPPKPSDLYTYKALVTRVVDGDTLWVDLDLGFGFSTDQKLRLRGIDAPELSGGQGQKAKRYLQRIFGKCPEIIVCSSKSDKYDRYLADIFVSGIFLNQTLLDKKLAARV